MLNSFSVGPDETSSGRALPLRHLLSGCSAIMILGGLGSFGGVYDRLLALHPSNVPGGQSATRQQGMAVGTCNQVETACLGPWD